MEGKNLWVVISSPGYRDQILVGWGHPDLQPSSTGWLRLDGAVNVIRYQEVGPSGIARHPDACTTRPAGRAHIPWRAISVVYEADPVAWEGHL